MTDRVASLRRGMRLHGGAAAAAATLAAAAGCAVLGVLTVSEAVSTLRETADVLAFLLLITVLADTVDRAGLFAWLARAVARVGGGRPWRLMLTWCALVVAATWTLSLDTAVVLLAPTALALAAALEIAAWPLLVAVVWLANTGSLLTPLANLTNLLAVGDPSLPGLTSARFVALMAVPQAAVLIVVAGWLLLVQGRRLGAYAVPAPAGAPRGPAAVAAAAVVALGPAVVAGVPAWAAAAAAILVVRLVLPRDRRRPVGETLRRAPWSTAALALGLFWCAAAAAPVVRDVLAGPLGGGDDPTSLVRLAAAAAVSANAVDNLPAYLAFVPLADSEIRRIVLLLAVDVGPLATPWASVATLLWLRACREGGVRLAPAALARFFAQGAVVAAAAWPQGSSR